MSNVVLTKQSAAHRLILAGIKMFERGDDQLATFVVASSAFSTLRELVKVKGESYQLSILKEAIYSDAKRRVLGLPKMLPQHPHLDQAIDQIAEGIRKGEIERPDDLNLLLSRDDERAMINHLIDPYNFLKHADRDASASMDEGKIDPLGAIAAALAAYSRLFPVDTLPVEVAAFLEKHGILDPAYVTR